MTGSVIRLMRLHAKRLAVVAGLSLLSAVLSVAQPYFTKELVDNGLLAGRFDVVVRVCAIMVVVGLLAMILGAVTRWLYVDASARMLSELRESTFSHLMRLSPAFYATVPSGEILTRLDGDIAEIQRFYVDSLLTALSATLVLVASFAMLIHLNWALSLFAVGVVVTNWIMLRAMRPHVESVTKKVRSRAGEIGSFLVEMIWSVKTVQAFCMQRRETLRLARLQDKFRHETLQAQSVGYAVGAVPGFVVGLGTAATFVAGGYLVIVEHSMSIGALIAFSAYLARVNGPVQSLLGIYVAHQRATVSLSRIGEILAVQPAIAESASPVNAGRCNRGSLRLENVSFSYREGAPAALNEVDLVIPAGSRVALVGASGAGKSTLVNLLQRHFDPSGGRILLDDVDLREIALADLRKRIAVVSNDPDLMSGSVAYNIGYSLPEASPEEIEMAAQRAQVAEFATRLPQGYQADVGQRGTMLSAGQRQRIAIARALLLDPVVLVFDEATSSVDGEVERSIAEAVDRLFGGRTRIVISHHMKSFHGFDMVVMLERGLVRVVGGGEGGTNDARKSRVA